MITSIALGGEPREAVFHVPRYVRLRYRLHEDHVSAYEKRLTAEMALDAFTAAIVGREAECEIRAFGTSWPYKKVGED